MGIVKSLMNLPELAVILAYTKYFKSISLHKPFDDDMTEGTMSEPSVHESLLVGSHIFAHLAITKSFVCAYVCELLAKSLIFSWSITSILSTFADVVVLSICMLKDIFSPGTKPARNCLSFI
jgi:hypothetical protein